jgi:hypothetical protein
MSDPYRRLAAAIIYQAVKDAASNEKCANSAKRWILSEDCKFITDCLDMTNSIRRWLESGCPKPNGRMYRVDKVGDRNYRKRAEMSNFTDVEE